MTILQRHSLRQFFPPFFLAIVIMAFVLLMDRLFLLADLLVRKGVAPVVVYEVMLLSLPFVISVAAPLGSLIAGVVTFGRMSEDNEVGAIRAAGIPMARVFVPTVIASVFLMFIMVGFNSFIVPEAQHRVRNLLTDVARKKPAMRVREGVFMTDFANYRIYIGSIDERRARIKDVAIFERKKRKQPPGFITAPEGEISYTPDDRYMILTLYNGEMHELKENDTYRRLSFKRHVINIEMNTDLIRRDRKYRSSQEMMLPQLLGKIGHLHKEIGGITQKVGETHTNSGSEAGRLRLDELQTRLRYKRLEAARYQVEFQKKLSLAFSCFFFLLFGAPLGILLHRGGIGTGFIIGLVFFAIYYILLLSGQNLANSGRLSPFVGMWLPNILLVVPVVEMLGRAFFEQPVVWRWSKR